MKLKHVAFVFISIALIAGCIIVAGCTSQITPTNNTSGEKILQPLLVDNPTEAIVGDWIALLTDSNNEKVDTLYHFEENNIGTFTTISLKGTAETDIHWVYDATQKVYMINYDKLGTQEYMIIYTDEDGALYLLSPGGGIIYTKL